MRYYSVREAKWITLGAQAKRPGTKGANGKKHGGVAVLIGDDGVILKGPAHMKGKKPDELGGRQKTLGEKPGEKQEPKKYQNLAFGPNGEIAEPDKPKSPPPGAGYSDLRAAAKVEPVTAPPAPTAAKPAKTKAAKSQKPPESYDDKQDKKHARNLARLEKSRKELADIGDAARTLLAKAPPEMHAKIQDMIDRADAERNNLAAALKPTEFPDMGEPPPMVTDYTPGADYSDSYDDLRKAAAQPAPEPTPAPAPAKPVKVPKAAKVAKPEPVVAPIPEPKPEKSETVRAKIARIKAEKEKRYNDTLKKRGKKEADKQKADDKRQAKAEKDALNPAQAEARKKKQVERISKINAARPESLISLVRKEGGISGGDYDYATDIKEFGLKSAMNKRGLKLDDMAKALQNAGHIVVPEGKKAEDVLLAGLQTRANSALHNHTSRYDSEYDDFINNREDADNAPGADSDRTASVISRGEEAGENQGDDDGLAQILGLEPNRSDADEPEPSDYGHPDDYEPSDYEPEEGDLGDGGEITGADTSFDFGAPEPEPVKAPAPSPASPPVDMFGNATTTAKKQPDMMTDMFGARIQAEAPKVTPAPTVADDAAKSLDWLDKNDPKKDGSAEMFGSLFSPGASGASAKTQPEAPGEGFADLRAAAAQIKEPQRGWTSERQDFHRTGIGGVNTHAGKTSDGAAEFDELKNKLGSDSGEIASVNLGELYKKHLDAAMQQGGVDKKAFDSAMAEGPTGKNYSRLTALNGEAARRTRAELKEKTGPYIAHNTDGAIAAGYHANPADMVPGATDTDYRRSSAAIITGPETQAKNYKAIYGKPAKAGPALAEPLFGNQPAPAPTPATAPEPGTGYDDLRAAAAKEPEAKTITPEPSAASPRDLEKSEQRTPDEHAKGELLGNRSIFGGLKRTKAEAKEVLAKRIQQILDSPGMSKVATDFGLTPEQTYTTAKINGKWAVIPSHASDVATATYRGNPVSAEAVEKYGIILPKNYTKQGEMYVAKPSQPEEPEQPKPPEPKKKKPPTQKTKGLTDDPEKFQQGDRFKGENGEEFQVFASRQGTLTAHPVVDGKPQINKSTEKKFAITDAAAATNPTHRRDFVPGFDQSQPGRDSEEIAQDRARLAKTPNQAPGEGFADLRKAANLEASIVDNPEPSDVHRAAKLAQSKYANRIGAMEFNTSQDGKTVEVHHHVTGTRVGEIDLDTGRIVPEEGQRLNLTTGQYEKTPTEGNSKKLDMVHQHLKTIASVQLAREKIGLLRNRPNQGANKETIKALQDKIRGAGYNEEPEYTPTPPPSPGEGFADLRAAAKEPATPPPTQKPIDLPPKTPDTTSPGATTAPEPEKSKVEHFSVTASGRGFSQAIALLKKRGGKFNPATKTWAVPTGKVTANDASSFGLQQKAFPQAVRSKRDEDNFGNEDDPERFRVYR